MKGGSQGQTRSQRQGDFKDNFIKYWWWWHGWNQRESCWWNLFLLLYILCICTQLNPFQIPDKGLRSRISLHMQVFVCSWFMANGDHFWWWEQRLKVTLWRVGCWPKNLNANLSPLVMMHYTGCVRLMGVFTLAQYGWNVLLAHCNNMSQPLFYLVMAELCQKAKLRINNWRNFFWMSQLGYIEKKIKNQKSKWRDFGGFHSQKWGKKEKRKTPDFSIWFEVCTQKYRKLIKVL